MTALLSKAIGAPELSVVARETYTTPPIRVSWLVFREPLVAGSLVSAPLER